MQVLTLCACGAVLRKRVSDAFSFCACLVSKASRVTRELPSPDELLKNARLCDDDFKANSDGFRGARGKTSQGNIENRLKTVQNTWKFIENRETGLTN